MVNLVRILNHDWMNFPPSSPAVPINGMLLKWEWINYAAVRPPNLTPANACWKTKL
jgi:hypothetical protein